MKRKIYISGEINTEAYTKFTRRLTYLENQSNTPIHIELSSEGGTAYDALAIAGRIRNSPCTITITAYGLVASAAVIILAVCDKRYMSKEAWVMVHEDSGDLDGNVKALERQAAHLRRMEKQWNELLSEYTDKPIEFWEELHEAETHLDAFECLEYGLVDKIL